MSVLEDERALPYAHGVVRHGGFVRSEHSSLRVFPALNHCLYGSQDWEADQRDGNLPVSIEGDHDDRANDRQQGDEGAEILATPHISGLNAGSSPTSDTLPQFSHLGGY